MRREERTVSVQGQHRGSEVRSLRGEQVQHHPGMFWVRNTRIVILFHRMALRLECNFYPNLFDEFKLELKMNILCCYEIFFLIMINGILMITDSTITCHKLINLIILTSQAISTISLVLLQCKSCSFQIVHRATI